MTPTTIDDAPDVLLALPVAAELAADGGDEDEELHPARASAARTIAGNPAHALVRRNLVIAASPFLAGSRSRGSRRGLIAVSDGDVTVRNGT
jgi:hypothetical protein